MLKFDSNHVIVGRQRPLWPGMVSRDGEWIRLANGLVTSSSFDKDRLKVVKFRNALESVLCPSQGCRCGQVTLSRSQFYFYKNDLPLLKLCVCTRQTHAYTKIHAWRSEDTLRDSVFSPFITWVIMIELRSTVFVASSFTRWAVLLAPVLTLSLSSWGMWYLLFGIVQA